MQCDQNGTSPKANCRKAAKVVPAQLQRSDDSAPSRLDTDPCYAMRGEGINTLMICVELPREIATRCVDAVNAV